MSEAIPPKLGLAKTLLYSLLPTVLLLLTLEIAARVIEIWAPPRPVDIGQGFTSDSRLFVPKPSAPWTMHLNPAKETSFVKSEFARGKPARTLRIFALGESSVNYLNGVFPGLEKRLRYQYKDRYDKVEIINCGGLSYGSHRLVPIAAEVLDDQPDLIMVYLGHNEFEELEQLEFAGLDRAPVQRTLSHFALFRFVRDRIASYKIGKLQREHNERIAKDSVPDTSRAWGHQFTLEELATRMDTFRKNYSLIIEMCQERGVPIVIGSVPSNLWKPSLYGEPGERYEREAIAKFKQGDYAGGLAAGRAILRASPRHQSSDAENEVIRGLAERYKVPLADVENAVLAAEPHGVPGETLFNDHCHLNNKGNDILIAQYEEQFHKILD